MRNNTGIKKIPSSSYVSSSSMNNTKLTNTINYTIKEENEKIENRPKIFKERNERLNCLKNLKKHFFSGNLMLPKSFWFKSGKNINDKIKNKKHKNTFSDIQLFGPFLIIIVIIIVIQQRILIIIIQIKKVIVIVFKNVVIYIK